MGEFARRLKKLRKNKHLTQDKLAPELGISRSTLGMYETGKREPDFETLETIADYFNVDMNYLMGWTDDPYDWKKIGNEAGIYPPKDYEGTYEDYVKYKLYEEQDALIDEYYDTHPNENINAPYCTKHKVYIDVEASSKNEAIFLAIKKMLEVNGDYEKASTLTESEAVKLYEISGFEAIDAPEPSTNTTAAHKDGENFTPEELEKIEEYKKLLLAARPKE